MSHGQRRYRRRHGDVDDWLMTYADMITLLLCFFAVLLSVSTPEKKKFDQAREEVIEQFGIPDIVEDDFPDSRVATNDTQQAYDSLPSIVDHFADPQDVAVEEEGDRIKTLEMNSAAFFGSGQAILSDEGKTILEDVLKMLKSEEYRDYTVTVEGHTDDNPIATAQFPSNWELSTARAAAVVRYFLQQGIPANRLRASGYADTFPKVPNRDATGQPVPANQAQNRRVLIKLEKIDRRK